MAPIKRIYISFTLHNLRSIGFLFWRFRAANVLPCARLVNVLRPASRQIPMNHQKALWFSGELFSSCLKVDCYCYALERESWHA